MSDQSLSSSLGRLRGWVDSEFQRELHLFNWHPSIADSARHVLISGGKALRPACVFWAYAIGRQPDSPTLDLSKPPIGVMQWALALEMVHTYSLVHDDLPAMDNDDFRRGKPTLHVLKNSAEAILAGDALLTGAFELLARADTTARPENLRAAVVELARAAGGAGMIAGQVRDLHGEKIVDIDRAGLEQIHREKTGALFGAAFVLGALAADIPIASEMISRLRIWGVELGLLFQVVDDVLDATGSLASLGKSAGKDDRQQKSTYVSALGLKGAKDLSQELASSLKASSPHPALEDVVDFVTSRDR